VTYWRNVYTFSTTLTAWYHFIRRQRFYGDLISPATVKRTYVFMKYPIFVLFGISRRILQKFPVPKLTEICSAEVMLIHTDGQKNGRTWWRQLALFTKMQTSLRKKCNYSRQTSPLPGSVFVQVCSIPMLMIRATVRINLYPCLTRQEAMKAYGEVDLCLRNLYLKTRGRWLDIFIHRSAYSCLKSSRKLFDLRMCGSQIRSGRFREEEVLLTLLESNSELTVLPPVN